MVTRNPAINLPLPSHEQTSGGRRALRYHRPRMTKSRGIRPPRPVVPLEEKVFVRLTRADVERLERIAKRLGWSRGAAIRAALRSWFMHHEK